MKSLRQFSDKSKAFSYLEPALEVSPTAGAGGPARIRFVNLMPQPARIVEIDRRNGRRLAAVLSPFETRELATTTRKIWAIGVQDGSPLQSLVARPGGNLAAIRASIVMPAVGD